MSRSRHFLLARRCGSHDPLRIMKTKGDVGRTKTLGKIVKLIADLLDGKEHDRNTAAELLSTTPSNAARHLDAIYMHLGLVKERQKGKIHKYYIDAFGGRPAPPRPALIGACFASSLATLFEPSKYGVAMREALTYILEAVRAEGQFTDIDRRFFFLRRGGEPAVERPQAHLDVVVDALLEGRYLELTYKRFDAKVTIKTVRPLSIVVYEHQLYLVAYDSKTRPGIHRIARIRAAEMKPERFTYPTRSEYDPEVLFRSQFGVIVNEDEPISKVVVRLAPRWRVYADDHRWHPSQQTSIENEHVIVRFELRICEELKRWIMSFGDEAEVMEPIALREEVAQKTRKAAALYEQPEASKAPTAHTKRASPKASRKGKPARPKPTRGSRARR